MLSRWLPVAAAILAPLGGALPAEAYIGPGAGFAFLSSFLVLAVSFALALLSVLLWPFRLLLNRLRRRTSGGTGSAERVVIVGLDGLDPGLAERYMAEGKLPNFSRLKAQGTFTPLATSYPSISPAAWSSFMTGVDCSHHNIFDFLTRDPRNYMPVLSSAEISGARTISVGKYKIPVGKPRVKLLRKSRPFWKILGERGVFSSIIRVPITFPPEKFHGHCLSGMCTPDLRGSQGTFSYYTTKSAATRPTEGGMRVPVTREGSVIRSVVRGPQDTLRSGGGELTTPLTIRLDEARNRAEIDVSGQRLTLEPRSYSPWVPVTFRVALGLKVHGICRFYLNEMSPDLDLYVTPIQIDPEKPALPISHPFIYSVYLAKLNDRFGTLGLAEDTWALNEGVIDEEGFLEQAYLYFQEREAQLFTALGKTRRGLTVCVFDTPDRIQHMFFRCLDPAHPANEGKETEKYRGVIEEAYRRMDDLVGRVMAGLDDKSVLIVMSDHGFTPFRRGVNVNTWLLRNGYLALKDAKTTSGEWFADVDWGRTRAYCLGLTGIFVNRRGREGQGIVDEGGELRLLKRELVTKLTGLVDDETGQLAVREIQDAAAMFSGPYLDNGPDLLLGFNAGFRISWECASGKVTPFVFENNTKRWSGDHCVDPKLVPGIFFCSRPINGHAPDIRDVAPTVLRLFGVDIPTYMEGKPLLDDRQSLTRSARASHELDARRQLASRRPSSRTATMPITRDALRPLKALVKRYVSPAFIDRLLLAFPEIYPALRYESQLSPAQFQILQQLLRRGLPGNIIECGVYRAGTAVLLARMLAQHDIAKRIYALDSFGGFATDIEDEIRRGLVVEEGRTAFRANSVEYVRRKLAVLGVADRIEVVPGFFENTLPTIDDRFCLALIDCDLEQSIAFCLEHLWAKMVDGAYVVVDDYANPGYPGAALAADRFFARVSYRSRTASDNFLVVEK